MNDYSAKPAHARLRPAGAGCRKEMRPRLPPLAEGPAAQCATAGKKYRSWMRMSDDELLSVVNRTVLENGIIGRKMLREFDSGMASRLAARGLWGRVEYCNGGGAKRAAAQAHGAQESAGENEAPSRGHDAAGKSAGTPVLGADEILFLAQSVIDDGGLADMGELAVIDPEIHGAVVEAGAGPGLRFHARIGMAQAIGDGDAPRESACGTEEAGGRLACNAGSGRDNPGAGNGRAHAMDEESMYRMICAECFRIGGASPFIGGCRTTIPKLQSAMHRKLGGPDHKLFRKCWDRMAAEGAIAFNSNGTAASLNPYAGVRDGKLRSALEWAAAEQRRP